MSSTSMFVSDVLSVVLQEAWEVLIPTYNPRQPNPMKRLQNLPMQNVMMNYLVDLDLLALGKDF